MMGDMAITRIRAPISAMASSSSRGGVRSADSARFDDLGPGEHRVHVLHVDAATGRRLEGDAHVSVRGEPHVQVWLDLRRSSAQR